MSNQACPTVIDTSSEDTYFEENCNIAVSINVISCTLLQQG